MSTGGERDPNHYSQEHVLKFVKLYNKDVIQPLEMACREARSLSPDDREEYRIIAGVISAAPESIQEDLRLAVAALYLPRLTDIVRTVNRRIKGEGEHGPNVERTLMVLLFLFEASVTSSPYLWTFLLDPQNAAVWATFMALHIGGCLLSEEYQPTMPACVGLLREMMLVLKPVRSRPLDADGRTCLPRDDRMILHNELRAFLGPGREGSTAHISPNVKRMLVELCAFLDRVTSRGRTEWREGHAEVMEGHPKCSVCEWVPAKAVCGRCQCFRYCSRRCQRADWYSENGHRVRCFRTNYRGIVASESDGTTV